MSECMECMEQAVEFCPCQICTDCCDVYCDASCHE